MLIKTNNKFLLLFYFFFATTLRLSSSASFSSFGNRIPRPRMDLDLCINQCREVAEEFTGLFACAAVCDSLYGKGEPPETSPWQVRQQCQQSCLPLASDWRLQQWCQRSCEGQAIGWREEESGSEQRERDQEREREQYQGTNSEVSREPEEEYEECKHLCKTQEARQEPQCKKRCKRQQKEQKENKGGRSRNDDDEGDENSKHHHHDLKRKYEQCQKQREKQEKGEKQQQCKSRCKEQKEKEEKEGDKEGKSLRGIKWGEDNEEQQQQQQGNNPYYFPAKQSFQYRFSSQEGNVRVLQRFSQKSNLLRSIDNYRMAILEANPSTLVVPHHTDAETVLAVIKGRGIITLVSQEKRESFKIEYGDALRIPAGTTFYLINQDIVDKLQLAKLIQPINTPGLFREYFAAGGGNPPLSYYRVFGYDILERALNTPRNQLDMLFAGEQWKVGTIKTATEEQLKALAHHASNSQKNGDKDFKGPYNLLSRKPLYRNKLGRFFEATPDDYKQLREVDTSVTFVEINQGAMMVPHYNSKTTTVFLVVTGSGRFEMGCPHLSSQSQESPGTGQQSEEAEQSSGLQKITANLSPGDVFIIPPGHPIALVASQYEKLLTVGFGINALNNRRNFLAGKNNIINQVQKEAMEIAFNVPARLVDRIFSSNPNESYFVAAGPELVWPEEQQQQQQL